MQKKKTINLIPLTAKKKRNCGHKKVDAFKLFIRELACRCIIVTHKMLQLFYVHMYLEDTVTLCFLFEMINTCVEVTLNAPAQNKKCRWKINNDTALLK